MGQKRILFIGGTGVISSACVDAALGAGHHVTILNRGESTLRPAPVAARVLRADIRDTRAVHAAIGDAEFDVVADFLAYTPEHVRADLTLFRDRIGQYIFISSASAYQTPPARLPITESTPLRNPYWQYSRDKIACEELLTTAYRDHGFPATIVRPSHTYDRTMVPTMGHWTDISRIRSGRPVVVPGDGTSLWTLTHSADFAVAFTGLLGRHEAVGDSFHITADHAATWNQIYRWLAEATGAPIDLVHVPSDLIARIHPELGPGLLGDKAHSMVFDNSKVKALVPAFTSTLSFQRGAEEIIDFHDRHPELQVFDPRLDAAFDAMVSAVGG